MRRGSMAATMAATLAAAVAAGSPVWADCAAPQALAGLGASLERSGARLAQGEGLTIVAFGSSSTSGVGASRPDMSYPSRLEAELRERFPQAAIRVVNHGVGGEDVGEELKRLGRDVVAEHPDLVIWQVGTNAVLRREDLSVDRPLIERGVAMIEEQGIDLVLMDLQYAPRVLARSAHDAMERLIDEVARNHHVGLFHRFAIMRRWVETGQLAPASVIGADDLHMTDASYGCLASDLAEALAWDWGSQLKMAVAPRRAPAAVAGLDRAPVAAPVDAP